MTYNIMSCSGGNWVTGAILGDCSFAWFSLAIVFFLALILRRQCAEGFLSGTGFNFIGSMIGGLGLNLLLTTLTGSARWSLLAGIAGIAIGGFLVGMIFDTSSGGEEYG